MAHSQAHLRQINVKVSDRVGARLDQLAKEASTTTTAYAGMLFDAAYAARVKGTPDAELDAHVSLVGLAMMSGHDLEQIAVGSGLPMTTVERMRDAWKAVLAERRRCQ